MYRGCIVEKWNHTSVQLALLANCNRDPKRHPRPYEARKFHPFPPPRPKLSKAQKQANLMLMREVFSHGVKDMKTVELKSQKVRKFS